MNSLFNVIDKIIKGFLMKFDTFIYRIVCKLKEIKIGRKCKFYGLPKFVRTRDANIIIGNNVCFRSRHTSNMIGVNRPCMLSVYGKGSIINIGDNCGFSGTVIGCFSSISLGKNVRCGANTLITDGDWHPDDPRSAPPKPIVIEDNVWLGEGAVVLKGVTIGENSIIGIGSIVTRDIPANVVAAGNPCKVIKSLTTQI